MPVPPGARVKWIPLRTENPHNATFTLYPGREPEGAPLLVLSVANGGLEQRRKNALHPVFHAPKATGTYAYVFTDGEQVATGHVRVRKGARPAPTGHFVVTPARARRPRTEPPPEPPPRRRYTGPGAR